MCDIEKPEEEILIQVMQFHDDDTETRGHRNLLIGFCVIKVGLQLLQIYCLVLYQCFNFLIKSFQLYIIRYKIASE